jgi:hypothetical protein
MGAILGAARLRAPWLVQADRGDARGEINRAHWGW